ncbi:hypothetical protein EKO23_06670 [Nocardioides guangzhouensis]|uniref:histidine kinase n=1 Tax=Nocardioides guangzhouensis TaxID=2497878 RepID=A0A4Q4ZIJ4_9ACTN|nr:ATP-binding protein [Nocardioides guangzhouensis]RYP87276.1 hypothetical protein EKO23_06670 [Nocardioides guangzhouensis]
MLELAPAYAGSDPVRALYHDLRQPLGAIRVLAEADGVDPERRLALIADEVAWMGRMVESVLTDAADDDLVVVDVVACVRRALASAEPAAHCALHLHAPVEGAAATARPVALTRAIACLVDNAVRAAGPGGRVDVAVTAGDAVVEVAVRDDGPGPGGLAPQTSLGLATTRALVASCTGTFRLAPGPDGGAEAAIWLSAARDEEGVVA